MNEGIQEAWRIQVKSLLEENAVLKRAIKAIYAKSIKDSSGRIYVGDPFDYSESFDSPDLRKAFEIIEAEVTK